MVAVLAVTSFAALSIAAPAGPAGAAPQPFTLAMVPGEGQLTLAGNDPFEVETPTSFSGTIDDATGVLSNLAFSTPDIAFEQEAEGLAVDVIAKLTLLAATGNADGLGNVSIDAAIRLDVNLNVGGGAIVTDCVSSPVNIALVSTAPYNPDTGRVTLADPNFTIPPVQNDGTCNSLVIDPVNEALAGPGNSFRVTLEGDLALPPPPGDPSETTLASDAPSTALGFPATFTATVEPDDATGNVFFFNGTTQIGQAPLNNDAEATFTTSALPVGTHQITARYLGNVDYEGSTSNTITHTITAVPTVTAELPPFIVTGADPVEFPVTFINPSSGSALPNLRADFTFGSLTNLTAGALTFEYDNNGTWVNVPRSGTHTVTAQFPDANGFSLNPGQEHQVRFRLGGATNIPEGLLPVAVSLVTIDPDDDNAIIDTLGTATTETWIVGTERRTTTGAITLLNPAGVFGIAGPVARVGDALILSGSITRGGDVPLPGISGQVEILIDGQVVDTVGLTSSGGVNVEIFSGPDSPLNDLTPGERQVQIRYLGDNVYRPSVSPPVTLTLAPWVGERYTCIFDLVQDAATFAARVDAHAVTPAAALPGTEVPLAQMGITTWTNGSPGLFALFGGQPTSTALELTGGATGTFTGFAPSTQPPGQVEGYSHMAGLTGSVVVEGEPGDVIDVAFDTFTMGIPFGLGLDAQLGCEPNGVAEPVASIMVAGTVLESSAAGPVEEGSSVPLTANVFPATAQGLVEFFDGSESIGLAPVSGGVAQIDASGLGVGAHEITARYLGDLVVPASVSEPVAVVVRDAILCPSQAVEGSGAVVRSTYLNLLGRCAEPLGFSYWTTQLDGGLSAEVFARQVASSLEAHGRSVDDGYQLILGRNADVGGRGFWAQRLNAGQRYDALLGDLAASNEFWTASGSTNNGYVTRLYDRLLHRAPDTAGLNYWVGRLNAGQSRASVAAAFVRLPEPSGQIVSDAYRNILDRGPTADERTPAVTAFQGDGHRWRIYASLIGTEEFFDRSQTFPNPS